MEVQPISGALGAEIVGIDLSRDLSNSEAADVYAAFLKHKVVFFRGNAMEPDRMRTAARLFGEPEIYPFIQGLPETPEVIEILKTEADTVNFGGSWHSDTTYMPEPAKGTVLHALEVPASGGDTLFANTALAYDTLSDGMKDMLANLKGYNNSEARYKGGRAAAMNRLDGMKKTVIEEAKVYESEHPIVRIHPETGVKSLYLNRGHTKHFVGMTEAESAPLIDYLCTHIVRPEFTCRFRWSDGAVAVWDNRATQHFALNDYQGKRRHMRRITLKGDAPR
jgi:taurine dioxygenase